MKTRIYAAPAVKGLIFINVQSRLDIYGKQFFFMVYGILSGLSRHSCIIIELVSVVDLH